LLAAHSLLHHAHAAATLLLLRLLPLAVVNRLILLLWHYILESHKSP
jgi:hypothetical protein